MPRDAKQSWWRVVCPGTLVSRDAVPWGPRSTSKTPIASSGSSGASPSAWTRCRPLPSGEETRRRRCPAKGWRSSHAAAARDYTFPCDPWSGGFDLEMGVGPDQACLCRPDRGPMALRGGVALAEAVGASPVVRG